MTEPVVLIEGTGALADAVTTAIAASGIATTRDGDGLTADAPAPERPDLVVVVGDDVAVSDLLDRNAALVAAGTPALFVVVDTGGIAAGPVIVPGTTACLECRVRAGRAPTDADAAVAERRTLRTARSTDLPAPVVAHAVAELTAVLGALHRGDGPRRPFTAAHRHDRDGLTTTATVLPDATCAACATAGDATSAVEGRDAIDVRLELAALAELAPALEREGFDAELAYSPAPADHPDRYRTVGILGGGTAGYLAALTLQARIPGLEITLIESSKIPIISVGEATTPEMVRFLHDPDLLGFDIVDFHQRVQPAFKLGIKFLWGEPGDGQFNYPFQYAPLGDPMVHDGDPDGQNVASMLMSADRAPLIDDGKGGAHSLLEQVHFAYHLDNVRFVRYLGEQALARGITHLDTTIVDAAVTADGSEIDHLVTDDGQELRFDLYVDASGFRSVLMEKALGSPFVSYAPTLFTDSAIACDHPHDGIVKPYTRAHTLSSGWCWTIPFEEADHIGYVYSSAFEDEETALAEMKRNYPHMGEHRHVRFRSGRHEHFIRGNVVAIGNAYAFVEPLESTALHMVIYELEHLTNHFPLRHDQTTKDSLNRKMNDLWDQLRWFLGIHYRFNRRLDTPFWDAVRAEADISGATERLALFAERAPLSDRPSLSYSVIPPDFFSGDHAFDTLLLGQRVPGRLGPARTSPETWRHRVALRRRIADHAIPQARALPLLRHERPDLLQRFVDSPTSWVHNWIHR